MFRTYLKTTLRNLQRNKGYSFLNIFGLAIGIACAALIFLWVEDEINYDGTNVKKKSLYFVRVNAVADAGIWTHWSSPGVLGPAMQQEIPGIANVCRTTEGTTNLLFTIENKSIYSQGKFAEPSLFQMFTLPFVQGNPTNAFSQLYSLVITEKMAKKCFGNEANVIGKTVRVDNKQDYTIAGVIKDLPENSSLQFEWLAPFQIWYQQSPWASAWENNCVSTYAELKPEANSAQVNKQLYNFVQKRAPTSSGHVFLFAMKDWHLKNQFENGKQTGGGQIEYVRLFALIAWIILLIACINFMNLATARSEKRAREVGVRKVLGAEKRSLVFQFISEAVIMALVSALVAVGIILVALPAFNILVQKHLSVDLFQPLHLGMLVTIAIVCGLIAGSYPSLYLSSFKPVAVLKGLKIKAGSAAFIRKGLVVIQFTVSIVLIIATIIIYQQMQHIKSRDLGFNKDNLLQIGMQGDMAAHYDPIRQEILNSGNVENVALADHSILDGGNNTDGLSWLGKTSGKIVISWRNVNPEFFATAGMKMLEGRNFGPTDTVNFDKSSFYPNVIVTQSMAKLLGNGSAIGKQIFDQDDTLLHATVIGVVSDHVYGDMYGKPDPIMFCCAAPRFATTLFVRLKGLQGLEATLSKIEKVVKANNPAYPFQYNFVDDEFNARFLDERLVGRLSRVFAGLAILISCLGLFGLAAYTAERRIREVGIRKVLGASVSGITALLSKDFIKLVTLSCLVAFPLAWWMMHSWLQNYKYRVDIQWWVFIAAGAASVIIALITVSFQAIRAALTNPVKILRSE